MGRIRDSPAKYSCLSGCCAGLEGVTCSSLTSGRSLPRLRCLDSRSGFKETRLLTATLVNFISSNPENISEMLIAPHSPRAAVPYFHLKKIDRLAPRLLRDVFHCNRRSDNIPPRVHDIDKSRPLADDNLPPRLSQLPLRPEDDWPGPAMDF